MHSMAHALAPPQLHGLAPPQLHTLPLARLSAQRVIRLDVAGHKVWKVGEAEIQEVDGQELISIMPTNQSLVARIFQNNANVPRELKIAFGMKSLICSDGLQKLISIKNKWVEERSAPEQVRCTLFDP